MYVSSPRDVHLKPLDERPQLSRVLPVLGHVEGAFHGAGFASDHCVSKYLYIEHICCGPGALCVDDP